MVDLTSPASQAIQTQAMEQLDHALLGLVIYEYLRTLRFDYDVIVTRRWKFRYPLLMYWFTKYSTLIFIILTNVSEWGFKINCQGVGAGIDLTSGICMAGASCLLMLRAIALWGKDLKVVVPLVVLHLTQWAMCIHNGFIVKEHWGDVGGGVQACVFDSMLWGWIKAQFIYTMFFDLFVLVVALWALLKLPGRSSLWELLIRDGIIYFVLAFISYLVCTIVDFWGQSITFAFFFADMTTVLVPILACQSFVRVFTSVQPGTRRNGSSHVVSPPPRPKPGDIRSIGTAGIKVTTTTFEDGAYRMETLHRGSMDLEAQKGRVVAVTKDLSSRSDMSDEDEK